MRVGVIVFPGSNCDRDVYHVFKNVLGIDTDYINHKSTDLSNFDGVIVPGGFSYGDHLRAGAIAARLKLISVLKDFAASGNPVLGICNGFQVLVECGLLPGALMHNDSMKFVCKWVTLRVESESTAFTRDLKGQLIRMPVAHGEGNYYADPEILDTLNTSGQVMVRYVDSDGEPSQEANPNGSIQNIAGVSNVEGNVAGLMPHPERASEAILGSEDGLKIFKSMLGYMEERV